MLLNILLISISLSIDAFGVGISYKMKGVKITTFAKIIIGLVSVCIMWLSLKAGNIILYFFPANVANIIGVGILALIGLTFIRNALFGRDEAIYDFDKSKNIEVGEAIVLGFVLSADSISAGIAATTMGLGNTIIPFVVGGMQVVFLYLADLMISHSSVIRRMNRKVCGVFAGCLLLLIAVIRWIG